jgi:hypothetical protein
MNVEHLLPAAGQRCREFVSVDWYRDMARDRRRFYALQNRRRCGAYWDAAAAWLCLLLVGLIAGEFSLIAE